MPGSGNPKARQEARHTTPDVPNHTGSYPPVYEKHCPEGIFKTNDFSLVLTVSAVPPRITGGPFLFKDARLPSSVAGLREAVLRGFDRAVRVGNCTPTGRLTGGLRVQVDPRRPQLATGG